MNPSFARLCRLTFIAVVLIVFSVKSFGQTKSHLEFNYKVDSTKVDNQYQYNITIKVIEGNGPYTYYLYLGEPWNGGNLILESEKIEASTYIFKAIEKSSNYHVCVKGLTKHDINLMYINF